MSNQPVKIQINSLEALERLIGGDSQLEFDIRASVVQKFTEKHLKSIAGMHTMKNTAEAIKKEIEDQYFKVSSGYGPKTYTLNDKAREALKLNIDSAFTDTIRNELGLTLNVQDVRNKIESLLKTQADYIAAELTNITLSQRLEKMVDAKIKERLGLK